jgi:hypothetical protein
MTQDPRRDDPLQDEAAGWRAVLPSGADWMDEEQWAAYLARDPADPGPGPDPAADRLEFSRADMAAIAAECREISGDAARAAAAAARFGTTGAMAALGAGLGRRGPGQPGSAEQFPGEYAGPAGAFAAGMILDTAPGGVELGRFAAGAAGPDGRYAGASDDELVGAICALDRTEAHLAARKLAAIAEFIRRRPAPGCVLEGPAQMPAGWGEFAGDELALALAESTTAAAGLLGLTWELEVKLPGTRAAFWDGILRAGKARIIADATQVLDPEQARAAEALVLDRAGKLTPGGLRAAIARAVMQVAPDAARKRREDAAKDARVERWAEDSGNAALAGRELPPAEVLAADQRITWWARQLRTAGLDGTMDELRARAYLDLLLDTDSRPRPDGGNGPDSPPDGGSAPPGPADPDSPGDGGSGPPGPAGPDGPPPGGGSRAGGRPAGFAGRLNLTVPLVTALGLADRPGEIPGIGPIDPALARDLARAAATNPRTTWCVTITDTDGHAIGHGCGRPQPAPGPPAGTPRRRKPGPPGGHDPPDGHEPPGTGGSGGPGFTFTPASPHGPPGGYGTWRLATGIPGRRDLIIAIEPITTDQCDHRHEAQGHDPGVMLQHLSQVRHASCTAPTCRRPAAQCDFEHNTPYEAGGRTCLCNAGPKCRHDHRVKQDPRWHVEQLGNGEVRWTSPSGRQYTNEPTRYPI